MKKAKFDKKYVGDYISVQCKTEELANEFLALADGFGYKWVSGKSYIVDNDWETYKSKTIYKISSGTICYKTCALTFGDTIVEFKSRKPKKNVLVNESIPMNTKVFVWDDNKRKGRNGRYIKYVNENIRFVHMILCDDNAVICFKNCEVFKTTE